MNASTPPPRDKASGPQNADQSPHSKPPMRSMECGDLSPLSQGDLSPSHAETPPTTGNRALNAPSLADKSVSRESGDKSPHSKPPMRSMECGDLSPLSQGDLSPSHAETPPTAGNRALNAPSLADKSASRERGDKSPHSKPPMRSMECGDL